MSTSSIPPWIFVIDRVLKTFFCGSRHDCFRSSLERTAPLPCEFQSSVCQSLSQNWILPEMTKTFESAPTIVFGSDGTKNVEVDTTKRGHRHLSLKMVKGDIVMVNHKWKQSFESSPPPQRGDTSHICSHV